MRQPDHRSQSPCGGPRGAHRPVRKEVGSSALALLARLAGRGVPPGGKGNSGPVRAGVSEDAQALVAADLAACGCDGRLEITDAGRAHLARLDILRSGSTVDPFLGQHLDLAQAQIETDDGRASVITDGAESPLVWLARRKGRDGHALIEPVQVQAGERLRADFTLAQLMPRVTANWTSAVAQDRRSGDRAVTMTETVIAARQRLRHALDEAGPEFSGFLLDVCCFLKRLDDVERERGWPRGSAKVALQLGLDRLARHYGLAAAAHGRAHAEVRTWLAEDASFAVGE
jgi:hypothetical protein